MKIAKADVFHVAGSYILIRLVSSDGVVGWGEAHPGGGLPTVRATVALAEAIAGSEVGSIAAYHRTALAAVLGPGRSSGIEMRALSGMDVALHDLLARTLGVPVWELLGGRVRDRVPVYTSFHRHDDPEWDLAGEIARYLERGVRAVKLHTGVPRAQDDRPDDTVATVRALRELWPSRDELGIMIDVNSAFTVHRAVDIGRQLGDLDVWWLEEPVAIWDHEGFRRVHDMIRVPIAAGENEYLLHDFRRLVVDAGVDILQPNVVKVGGFTGAMKIAALAEAFNRPIACNNWCRNDETSLMTAVQAQFWAAASMCTLPQEFREDEPSRGLPRLTHGVVVRDGFAQVPDGPGLGVTLDEDRIVAEAERPFQ